jgi:hypothetical protein
MLESFLESLQTEAQFSVLKDHFSILNNMTDINQKKKTIRIWQEEGQFTKITMHSNSV